jgi:hypothetical protein
MCMVESGGMFPIPIPSYMQKSNDLTRGQTCVLTVLFCVYIFAVEVWRVNYIKNEKYRSVAHKRENILRIQKWHEDQIDDCRVRLIKLGRTKA